MPFLFTYLLDTVMRRLTTIQLIGVHVKTIIIFGNGANAKLLDANHAAVVMLQAHLNPPLREIRFSE